MNDATPSPAILRKRATAARTGLSVSQLDRLAADGKFPKPLKIGARAAGFVAAEVDAWIAERIRERDEGEQSAPQPARRGGRFAKNAAA